MRRLVFWLFWPLNLLVRLVMIWGTILGFMLPKQLTALVTKPLDDARKARRKALMACAQKVLPKALVELGFADGRRRSRKGDGRDPSEWTFTRSRDGWRDEVSIYWLRNGEPAFNVSFSTDQTERMKPQPGVRSNLGAGSVSPRPTWFDWVSGEEPPFGKAPPLLPMPAVETVVEDARQKLLVIDGYLRNGRADPAIRIYFPAQVGPEGPLRFGGDEQEAG